MSSIVSSILISAWLLQQVATSLFFFFRFLFFVFSGRIRSKKMLFCTLCCESSCLPFWVCLLIVLCLAGLPSYYDGEDGSFVLCTLMFGKKGFFRICATGTLTGFARRMVGNLIALFKVSEFHSERVHILSSLHLMVDFFCHVLCLFTGCARL